MKKIIFSILFSSGCFCGTLLGNDMSNRYLGERPSSEPYLSGDTFRRCCEHIIDIKNPHFDPAQVKKGDIIFLAPIDFSAAPSLFVEKFFNEKAPLIKVPYILVTHNSDLNITERFKRYLDGDKNLFAWFAQNVGFSHPKLINLPIGLENELWGRHYVDLLNRVRTASLGTEKKYLLYMNFTAGTNAIARRPAYDYFVHKEFCHATNRMSIENYLQDATHAKFVVSPHGNGLDCHRTWEALYLGVIPVVKKSSLDPLYEDLPVVIVNDWSEVTREFLEAKYTQMMEQTFKMEKLYIPYWKEVFEAYKGLCLRS